IVEKDDIEEVDQCNSKAIANWIHSRKISLLKVGAWVAAALYGLKVGQFLLEPSVGFCAYAYAAPQTLWGQYFYANAAHETAMRILGSTFFGFSPGGVANLVLAIGVSVVIIKTAIFVHNALHARQYDEYRIVFKTSDIMAMIRQSLKGGPL
ncbi:MAG: hypothetical protein ACXWM7_04810, partial [Parachlamydiaceae bacterium]